MDALAPRSTAALSSLSLDQSRQFGKKPTLQQVGKSFESLFMSTIMKSMRDAQIEGGLLDSEHEKPFQSMLDQAYSELAVKKMRLGIAESIERQFSPQIGKKNADLPPIAKGKD
jgi:flagellar protein FlgJ